MIEAVEAQSGESRVTRQAKLIIELRHRVVTLEREMSRVRERLEREGIEWPID